MKREERRASQHSMELQVPGNACRKPRDSGTSEGAFVNNKQHTSRLLGAFTTPRTFTPPNSLRCMTSFEKCCSHCLFHVSNAQVSPPLVGQMFSQTLLLSTPGRKGGKPASAALCSQDEHFQLLTSSIVQLTKAELQSSA